MAHMRARIVSEIAFAFDPLSLNGCGERWERWF